MPLQQEERGAQPDARVAVVGGGLVGSTQSMFLARKGFKVDLYEKREDCRTIVTTQGRSINMTLSARGREALKQLGLEDRVLNIAVPVHSRMIHSESGDLSTSPYSINGDCIYSLDRLRLNQLLLDQAESHPNITVHFKHKLVGADLSKKQLSFIQPSTTEKKETKAVQHVETDFIFGCDLFDPTPHDASGKI